VDDYLTKPFSFEVLLARAGAGTPRPDPAIRGVLEDAGLTLQIGKADVRRAKSS